MKRSICRHHANEKSSNSAERFLVRQMAGRMEGLSAIGTSEFVKE